MIEKLPYFLERFRPSFEENGRLHRLWPLFEAVESFLVVKPIRTDSGAHIRDPLDIKRVMIFVVIALIPSLLFGIFNVGLQYQISSLGRDAAFHGISDFTLILPTILVGLRYVLPIVLVSYATGAFWEILFAVVRRHEISEGFLVTGLLIPLTLPPTIPLWQVVIGTSFGVVIGKEVFGGTGTNIFNPALVARSFLFFAYPAEISGDRVWSVTAERLIDGYSGATPLLAVSGKLSEFPLEILKHSTINDYGLTNLFWGFIPGSIGETSKMAVLLGGIFLIITGLASLRIIISVFLGGYCTALLINLFGEGMLSMASLPAHYHLLLGGFAFGAVFMATDPVSAAGTNTGKIVYGLLIGFLTIIIRVFNGAYPEGMMLAILFMNAFAPLIDYIVLKVHIRRRRHV